MNSENINIENNFDNKNTGLNFKKKFLFIILFLISSILSTFYYLNLYQVIDFPKLFNNFLKDSKILIIHIDDTITYKNTVLYLRKIFKQIQNDPMLSGIILKIDSPGGDANATEISYQLISNFKKQKNIPIFSVIDGFGTSGAYYISVTGDLIFAKKSSYVGSIGSFQSFYNFKNLLNKLDIDVKMISTSEFSLYQFLFKQITNKQKDYMNKANKDFVDNIMFVDILKSRKNKINKITLKNHSDGRYFTGNYGKKIGLIDHIGILEDAIDKMLHQLKINEINVQIKHIKKAKKNKINLLQYIIHYVYQFSAFLNGKKVYV